MGMGESVWILKSHSVLAVSWRSFPQASLLSPEIVQSMPPPGVIGREMPP
jgi:hypothetical protein